jgi:putative ABC transport system substrate-binding protein
MRPLAVALAIALAASGGSHVHAQGEVRHRVAYLGAGSPEVARPFVERFLARLRELGYEDGRNLVFEARFARGEAARLPELARELAAWGPHVFVAASNQGVEAARAATRRIPIVMLNVGAPVESGLVTSLARPGGNVTGVAFQGPETSGKAFETLREALPALRRLACLYESEHAMPAMRHYVERSVRDARAMGVELSLIPVQGAEALEAALERVRRERPDGLFVALTGVLSNERARVIAFAAREKIPAIYTSDVATREGGLMSHSAVIDHWRDGADYVDRILRGTRPADLPVQLPVRYELVINLAAARALGLAIPLPLLSRADRVLE